MRYAVFRLITFASFLISAMLVDAQVRFRVDGNRCDGRTADERTLLNAVSYRRENQVRQLLRKGASANVTDDCGISILTYATAVSHPAIVKLLIDAGAQVNQADRSRDRLALFHALNSYWRENRYSVIKVLIDGGADVNVISDEDGETPLMKAVLTEDVRVVELLISAGANVNHQDDGRTAYTFAVRAGNQRLKEILLKAGADPAIGVAKYQKEWGQHAFFQAAADGRIDVVEAMLASGMATVDMVNAHKMTALMRAHDENMVDALVRTGANVNLRDEKGFTAVIWASVFRRASIVKKLIAAGADVNARTNEGKSAIDLAESDEIERLLKEAGANQKKSPF